MAQMWWVHTEEYRNNFLEHIGRLVLAGKKPRVTFVDDDRTPDQNSMSFALYKQVAGQSEDMSISDIRALCKLEVGVPLLRASDEGFDAFYRAGVIRLTYEQKIAAMEYVPVTSLMGKKVFSTFLDDVIRKFSQQGMSLVSPEEASHYEG